MDEEEEENREKSDGIESFRLSGKTKSFQFEKSAMTERVNKSSNLFAFIKEVFSERRGA